MTDEKSDGKKPPAPKTKDKFVEALKKASARVERGEPFKTAVNLSPEIEKEFAEREEARRALRNKREGDPYKGRH